MPDSMNVADNEHSETLRIWKLEEELRQSKAETKRANDRADRAEACREVAVAALAGGANPDLLVDVVGRIDKAGWTMKDGRPVMLNPDGTQISNVGPAEWGRNLRTSAPHLFTQPADNAAPSQPGAQNGGGGGKAISKGRDNPWTRDGWNTTEQARVFKTLGPDRAKAMAEAVGSSLGALAPK